jgi:HTH-type transcriptional regulator/antitoxin MqsA
MNEKMIEKCPLCGEGNLLLQSRVKVFPREHGEVRVELLYSHCDNCESELVTDLQSRENKKRLNAREKQYEGYLTGEQVFELRRRYNLTQKEAAVVFGGGPTAFSKYESEEIIPTNAMNKLLLVARQFPPVVQFLAGLEKVELRGIAAKKESSVNVAGKALRTTNFVSGGFSFRGKYVLPKGDKLFEMLEKDGFLDTPEGQWQAAANDLDSKEFQLAA